jgi:uncharacterized SAM-binding protein YcdF (DUF218 family)
MKEREGTAMKILIGLAALSCLYGALILSLASGTKFYLVWFGIGALFALAAVSVHTGAWRQLPADVRIAVRVVLAVVVVGIVAIGALISTQFRAKAPKDLDAIVVLGAQVKTTGPSRVLAYRLNTAADYLKANPKTRCIVSGGRGPNEPETEASAMRRYLIQKGIAPNRIHVENHSQNTVENIKYSAKLIDIKGDRIGIVTNNFHVYRGLSLAKKAGYRHVYGIAAPSTPLYLPNNMLREVLGVVKDKAAGNI